MNDPHEIIITTIENPSQPRVVQFSDLYSLRNDIKSMMYLWNTNCYYVDVVDRTFIINGGRKVKLDFGECKILYRRRSQLKLAVNTGDSTERKTLWLLGIEEKGGTNQMTFLIVSDDGRVWRWANKL